LDDLARFTLRHGAHNTGCPIYRESGDYIDAIHDGEYRTTHDPAYQCAHLGENCDNERFCEKCGAGPLRQGFTVGEGDSYGCDSHEPEGYEYTDDDDCLDYWTDWHEKEGNDCDCPKGCPCYDEPGEDATVYQVTINVIHSRTFDVPGRDPADALARYQRWAADGEGEGYEEAWGDNLDADEQPGTAQVDGHRWPADVAAELLTTLAADEVADQARLAALRGTDQEPYPRIEECTVCAKLFEPENKGDDICRNC
jgi:hypothetical protein